MSHTIEIQDEVMEQFRSEFKLSSTIVRVSDCGKWMTYYFQNKPSEKSLNNYERSAKETIEKLRLPLTAKRYAHGIEIIYN
ncbi:MAG: hypothetical protein JST87_05495 [Bacteroidetes bacterium]|nr:hypothetical protein [Bacteroidota bacterium]